MLETGLIGRLARPVSLCVGVAFESEFQSLACFHTKVKNSQGRKVRKVEQERSGCGEKWMCIAIIDGK